MRFEPGEGENVMTTAVEISDVTKTYEGAGGIEALKGVSFKVESGEFMAIAGPSGSGKTTLLNLVGALDVPTKGTIHIGGPSLLGLSRRQLAALRRDKVGFVFQAYNLIPVLTAAENAEYVLELQGV